MAILLQPCWDFAILPFFYFSCKGLHEKIKSYNLYLRFCKLHWESTVAKGLMFTKHCNVMGVTCAVYKLHGLIPERMLHN